MSPVARKPAVDSTDGLRGPEQDTGSARLEPGLPAESLREAVPYLRRPFMPEAIKFKIQTVFKEAKGCLVVAYIDARLVSDRLNAVLPDKWTATYEPVPDKPSLMWCHLSLGAARMEGLAGVTRSDIGEGQGATEGMRYKAAVSDSLKRAAVHFGVGVSVYALPQITLWANQEHVEPVKGPKGPSLKLTEHGHVKLREGYSTWLETKNRFGAPLDHGDVEGAVFDEDDGEPAETQAQIDVEPALEDDEALAMVARARELYAEIAKAGGNKGRRDFTPGAFNGQLQSVHHDRADLAKFVAFMEQRRDEILAKHGAS